MTTSGETMATTTAAAAPDGAARQRIDAALVALHDVADRPLDQHAAAYEHLHEELQGVLAEIDGA